jgi:predicted DNA-binding ArsR family transcriptional regulator
MQNIPNELIVEISKSITLQDLKSFASTSQEYKALLDKVVKEVEEIDKYIKETYHIRVTIREDRNIAYRFYICSISKRSYT